MLNTEIKLDPQSGKYVLIIDGKVISRTKYKGYIERKINELGGDVSVLKMIGSNKITNFVEESSVLNAVPPVNDFSVNERFEFLTELTTMVANFQTPSLICSGAGGLGKSYTINKTLEDLGYTDVSLLESDIEVDSVKHYRTLKGTCTPFALYRTLYENRNSIVIFDDSDRIFADPISVNLLKGALDSSNRRVLSWKSERMDESLPSVFEFRGGIIVITNINSYKLDEAVRTRSMIVDLSMNNSERLQRMETLINSEEFMEGYTYQHKVESLVLIKKLSGKLKELSLRTLIKTVKIRAADATNWARLAEYMLVQ